MIAGFVINHLNSRYASIREYIHEEATTCRAIVDAARHYNMDQKQLHTFRSHILLFLDEVIKNWSFRGMEEEKLLANLHNQIETLEINDMRQTSIFHEMLNHLGTINHTRSTIAGLYEATLGIVFWILLGGLASSILVIFILLVQELGYAILSLTILAMVPWLITISILAYEHYRYINTSNINHRKIMGLEISPILLILYFMTIGGLILGLIGLLFFGILFLLIIIWGILTLTIVTIFDMSHPMVGLHRISEIPYQDVWKYISENM
jgi:hypothetical protein